MNIYIENYSESSRRLRETAHESRMKGLECVEVRAGPSSSSSSSPSSSASVAGSSSSSSSANPSWSRTICRASVTCFSRRCCQTHLGRLGTVRVGSAGGCLFGKIIPPARAASAERTSPSGASSTTSSTRVGIR